jgi:hypothetical protein
MATDTVVQIARESEENEAFKRNLMKAATMLQPPKLPQYQVEALTGRQTRALDLGDMGIGAYSPYMEAAQSGLASGTSTLGEAANVLRGADTRGQFDAAQQALNQAAVPASQIGQLANVAGAGMGYLSQGVGALQGAAQMYDPASAQAFMNPYQQQVIDESIKQINRQGAQANEALDTQAIRAGAFGGGRDAVMKAEMQRNLAEAKNAAITNALSQGYGASQQQAMQAFQQQQANQLAQGQGLNQAAGQQASIAGQQTGILGQQSQLQQQLGQGIGSLAGQQFGVGSQMSQGLGALGSQIGNMGVQQAALGQTAQQLGQSDVGFLYNLGAQEQKQKQAVLDATRATTMQNAMQPYQQLAFQSDIYKGAPSSQMAMTTQNTATPSPFQQIAGLGVGLVSGAGAAKQAGLF